MGTDRRKNRCIQIKSTGDAKLFNELTEYAESVGIPLATAARMLLTQKLHEIRSIQNRIGAREAKNG